MPPYRVLFNDISAPTLASETRKSNRNLKIFSFLLFSIYYLGITISKLNILNIELTIDQTVRCIYLLIAIVIYELIIFCIRFFFDYSEWYTKDIVSNYFEPHEFKISDDDIRRVIKLEYIKNRFFGLTYSISFVPQRNEQNQYGEPNYDAKEKISKINYYWRSLRNRMLSFWLIEFIIPVLFAIISVALNCYPLIKTLLLQPNPAS